MTCVLPSCHAASRSGETFEPTTFFRWRLLCLDFELQIAWCLDMSEIRTCGQVARIYDWLPAAIPMASEQSDCNFQPSLRLSLWSGAFIFWRQFISASHIFDVLWSRYGFLSRKRHRLLAWCEGRCDPTKAIGSIFGTVSLLAWWAWNAIRAVAPVGRT